MPGARTRVKPVPADEPSASDEASQLELHLQRQLEEDVASDAYTECNIKHQEKEIITYLNENFNLIKSNKLTNNNTSNTKDDTDDPDVFLTPKCVSPYVEKGVHKSISASPSTELTKEYYALVPIEGNLLEKELIEQDVLSNAFHSIIKTQAGDLTKATILNRNKPTSLSLSSSHMSKTVRHSNSCDILNKCHLKDYIAAQFEKNIEKKSNVFPSQSNHIDESVKSAVSSAKGDNTETVVEKSVEHAYSPDSLITDEPSSSSDYLSAAYTFSPGLSSSGCHLPLNVGDSITKMENIFTSSDSGLENTGMLESLSSHKDVTLTDISLTESTLHDLTTDDGNNSNESLSSSGAEKKQFQRLILANATHTGSLSGPSSDKDVNGQMSSQSAKNKEAGSCKSSKEEKQRQNEEIVILESSSLSSETGSWESVFPPKAAEKEICEKFISSERQHSYVTHTVIKNEEATKYTENLCPSLVQKSPFKSTSCFIDAASLVDEEDDTIKIQSDTNEISVVGKSDVLPAPSQPVPCSTVKQDISPNDWSESNENDDSLEQPDNKDPDSIPKDLSPTIFEMTPITEDSLCTNAFEAAAQAEAESRNNSETQPASILADRDTSLTSTVFVSNTPHNSIMSLKTSLKQYESEESESDTTIVGREGHTHVNKLKKYNESSPIVSGGASIEDHLPQIGSHTGSPSVRRKIENIPIVSGAFIPPKVEENIQKKSPKPSNAAAWVVDMSISPKCDGEPSGSSAKKPGDRACDSLKNGSKYSSLESCNKSRSSVDSDSSEKSSHKFYIDLSSLPDALPPKQSVDTDNAGEKKNIFSMYIDLGEKPTKEMPARLSSTMSTKKSTIVETKTTPKNNKTLKGPLSEIKDVSFNTFEKIESLCNDPNISISEIISIPETVTKVESKDGSDVDVVKFEKHSRSERPSYYRHTSTVIQEEPSTEQGDLFVKLSDLDKPAPKPEPTVHIHEERVFDVRMTRSIPENNWGEQNNPDTSRSIEVISSFHSENTLSLNRLFPHLKNEFSRSMPGSLSGRTRSPLRLGASSSPGDIEEHVSDVSEMSSVQSSMCRSVVENSTTEETSQTSSLIGNCQSRLGQDLLRMFLEEIAPDVIVEVSGRRIKAHKCILSSRCQYFAGILSGGWVESAGNVIVLPPFSFNVVHFALCHIYSGLSAIPDSISIVELATIADMLGLEGLKEAIMFTLKAKYCHHFHRPCPVCTAGVLECFPLSSVYGLDDLYRKCLRWITKYFSKVWPTKAFATLPKELLDKCYQQHIINLTTDNLVETVYGCGITVASLQNSRWSESVARMCRRLVNAAAHFAAPRLVAVFRGLAPLPPEAPHPAMQALDDCLAAAIEWAPPDEACRAYAFLSTLVKEIRNQHYSKPDLLTNANQNKLHNTLLHTNAGSWRLQCEGALVRAAPRVVGTQAFKDLPPDLRKRLRELGCIMYGAQVISATSSPLQDRKTKSTYHKTYKVQNATATTRSLDIDHVRASFVPYSSKPAAPISSIDILKSNNDLRDRKGIRTVPPKVRTTKAQEERAKFNLIKNTNQPQDRSRSKTATARNVPFENTKPRYLEPRVAKENDKKLAVMKKPGPKMVSSSESSRNSSPIQARNLRTSRVKTRQVCESSKAQAMSQDSLATSSRPRTAEPSTDSLSESQNSNKYATYTKTKHTTKGSVESVKSSKCQFTSQTNNTKLKTKIPVYLNQNQSIKPLSPKHINEQKRAITSKPLINGTNTQNRKINERKAPGSLMNATKSSSAKMVPKIVKESPGNKQKQPNRTKKQEEHTPPQNIPIMERSGTFLKDEPTFGDKTTNIDIDQ